MKSVILLLAFVCFLAASATAYETVYSTKTSSGIQIINPDRNQGVCSFGDSSVHDPMPRSEAENAAAFSAYTHAGFSANAPLGGIAEQSICFTNLCSWIWDQGLYYDNTVTFMTGTYSGAAFSASKTSLYSNFRAGYPTSWNYSYWGTRIPAMTSNGDWINVYMTTYFTQLVCEGYKFVRSDASTYGFPTYPNGDVIDPRSYVGVSQRSHCGHKLQVDNSGRWLDVQCTKSFPWWGGLIIAVVCFVIVVVVIIVIMCCCLCKKNDREKHKHERQMDQDEDNIARVPTQSQIGMSRDTTLNANGGSYRSGDDDYEEGSQSSFSRE